MTQVFVGSDHGPEAEADPLLCLRARADGYQPTCGQLDHCPSCQLCADAHAADCPERTPAMTKQTDTPIPREAVTAAAREIHAGFDTAAPIEQHNARETAMEALTAALPLLLAVELERIAEAAAHTAKDFADAGLHVRQDDYLTFDRLLNVRAAQLRGEFRG